MTTKTRFAPSPTGLIHLGNLRTALFSWLAAHKLGGKFVLRIEDTDAERSRLEYVTALMADLHWLGLDWQEGPEVEGPQAPYFQSRRDAIYQGFYAVLEAQGNAYPCYCTPEELALSRKLQLSQGRAPRYAGTCRHLDANGRAAHEAVGRQPTLRFRVPDDEEIGFDDAVRGPQRFASADIGDFIIRRADGSPAFFFCNAVDDALMGITLVLRGEDHLSNTPRQILILQALNLPVPQYGHMALIVGEDGQPLSKRNGSRTVEELRASGFFPEALNNYLTRLGHPLESEALLGLEALAAQFKVERLSRSPARFDAQQLAFWQHQALLNLPWQRVWDWMAPEVDGLVPESAREAFVAAVRPNLSIPEDAALWAAVCFGEPAIAPDAEGILQSTSKGFWQFALSGLADSGTDFKALAKSVSALSGQKGKALFLPLRVALTGQTHGPELAALLPLIGGERAAARLHTALEMAHADL
ncbi:glutamate--tRNA ligase [Thermithiobacillus plumbiphilus]|uniref:Glutamate--tRNA ligase n=1 Tax=Thermithiobacillus plumbiphilus TaxID=1729899 RepID=A0ABU9DAW8_9PROT